MKNGVIQAVAAAAMVTGAASAQAEAVQWRVEDGGNGHWYRYAFFPEGGRPFDVVQDEAAAHGGHLATITSSSENEWLKVNVVSQNPSSTIWGPSFGAKLVGSRWTWVTGEAWNYAAWGGIEPTGDGPYIEFLRYGALHWNDHASASDKWIIEWSADCNSDGIVDFGQIRAGELDDANANNIPDCCEQGTPCDCPSDLNGDGVVNGADIGAILAFWGPNPDFAAADITRDGQVNGADLGALLSTWGPCGQ